MAQTTASLGTAKEYIREIGTRGRTGTLHSLRMLLNAYQTHDKRSTEGWFHAVATENHAGPVVVLFYMEDDWPDMYSALYVLDDGSTVTPHYVAGWNDTGKFLILSPVTAERRKPYLAAMMVPRRSYFAYLTPIN